MNLNLKTKEVLVASGCILALVVMVASPVLLMVGGMIANTLWYDYKNKSEFHRLRPHLESIVRKLDRELVEPRGGATYAFADKVEEVRPIDIQELLSKMHYEWTIHAERLEDGHLRVEILTYNRGHMGCWSLNYLSRIRTREQLQREETPSTATPMDGLWWSAVFTD